MFLFATTRREIASGLLLLVLVDCVRQCECMCGKFLRKTSTKSIVSVQCGLLINFSNFWPVKPK